MSIFEIDSLCRINSTLNRLAAGTVSLDKYNQRVDDVNRLGHMLIAERDKNENLQFDLDRAEGYQALLKREIERLKTCLAETAEKRDSFEARLRLTVKRGLGDRDRADAAEAEVKRLRGELALLKSGK